MKDVLRKKITLTGWMHNRTALIVVSVLLAVVLWAVVMTDNATPQERSLTVPVAVSLNDSYASQVGLRLLNDVTAEVTVVVHGPWSTVSALSADDIQVRADVSTVQKSGKQMVTLVPSRNSNTDTYEIVSCTPSQLEIECDYWETVQVPLEVDVSALSAADEKTMQLGAPVPNVGKEGTVSVSGPQSVVRTIAKLVAKPEAEEPLTETRNFSPELKAVTEKNAPVDLKNCTVAGLENTVLTVTVPVGYYKDLAVSLDWHNAPKGVKDNAAKLKIFPSTIKVVGPQDALTALGDTLLVSTVDFDHLTGKKYTWKFPVTLPDAVTCVGDEVKEAAVMLDLSGYTKKVVPLPLTDKNVTFTNNTGNLKTAVQKKTIGVTVYGTKAALEKVTASALTVTADMTGTTEAGLMTYSGTVTAAGVDDVWFYYGADATGIPVYVTVS